ncbi:MAG: 23S rRNA (uracil(1939)-C(5))-methyltransferase RlmD [Bacilli bacterium]|nr:23S rRNA (uracil(1939)-C(5))-methyltransferase RlmD [Bacilli bacterium]
MVIEKLDNKGRGICFVNNKITFVENALPGEDVEIEIISEKKKYNEAKVLKYNKLSNDRACINCKYYGICGGCDLLHMDEEKELEFKLKKVSDILKKIGGIDIEITEIISPNTYNYRNKATFQVDNKLGFFKKRTNDLIEVDNCLLVDNRINELIKKIKEFDLINIEQIIIRVSRNEIMIIIKCIGKIDDRFIELNVDSIVLNKKGIYKTIKGPGYIIEELGDYKFIVQPDSFFQVNSKAAKLLYDKVLEFADLKGNEKVLDLYCGTGTIGSYISKYVDSVVGVEVNKYAIEDAIKNKKLNHIRNIYFICSDANSIDLSGFDLIIVDPPRSGLDNKTINYLLNINPKKIVYVSCDPVTLARDLKILMDKYTIRDVSLVNMFPITEHVETVVKLEKK